MKFRFRSHDHIGAADAESDQAFLRECYVDTDIDLLLNCDDHRRSCWTDETGGPRVRPTPTGNQHQT